MMNQKQKVVVAFACALVLAALSFFFQQTYVSQSVACANGEGQPTWEACWQEVLLREPLHVLGSLGIIALLVFLESALSRRVRVSIALMLIVYFFAQEFFMHPLLYQQPLFKSIPDFLAWTLPLELYLVWQLSGRQWYNASVK